ncbi:hypothetical protein K432DRAFT_398317 [Lepidopterella palustris CBS 459.81]|uniref:Uncharacterized protein n=1 Tax=Lepidopterella palustris CBS 459.81 TaxID=1314670 RepID=A0A8E2DYY1_9PEZI|nr:hypothetical protein K432DRAFT_398317 [Lepidopterella palustris CBS 459.81]
MLAIMGPALFQYLKHAKRPIPEAFVFYLFIQLGEAVRFLHHLELTAVALGDLHEEIYEMEEIKGDQEEIGRIKTGFAHIMGCFHADGAQSHVPRQWVRARGVGFWKKGFREANNLSGFRRGNGTNAVADMGKAGIDKVLEKFLPFVIARRVVFSRGEERQRRFGKSSRGRKFYLRILQRWWQGR